MNQNARWNGEKKSQIEVSVHITTARNTVLLDRKQCYIYLFIYSYVYNHSNLFPISNFNWLAINVKYPVLNLFWFHEYSNDLQSRQKPTWHYRVSRNRYIDYHYESFKRLISPEAAYIHMKEMVEKREREVHGAQVRSRQRKKEKREKG